MKRRVVQGALLAVLCLTAVRAGSDQQTAVGELLHAKSLVAETEESFVHIGGGFFAYFNRRDGAAAQCSALSAPRFDRLGHREDAQAIRFSLRELGYASRLVYRPTGSLVLKSAEGRILSFQMRELDYVQVSAMDLPCYRLSACSDDEQCAKAILICCAVGTEVPVLVGTLYLLSASGAQVGAYDVEIRGRNNAEAENHLWKVVEVASCF